MFLTFYKKAIVLVYFFTRQNKKAKRYFLACFNHFIKTIWHAFLNFISSL